MTDTRHLTLHATDLDCAHRSKNNKDKNVFQIYEICAK